MFIEIVGESALLEELDLDRDDVEDAITDALGEDGEVTGAGIGIGPGFPRWNLDVQLNNDVANTATVIRLAKALIQLGLGTVRIRPEGREPKPANDLAG
jgi:hypothetical protein